MSIKIGKYTISRHDALNLRVDALNTKVIESQMIADKMSENMFSCLPEDCGIKPYEVGGTYEKEELVGYFSPRKPESAFECVFSLLVSDLRGIVTGEVVQLSDIYQVIKAAKQEVLEAAKGVEV